MKLDMIEIVLFIVRMAPAILFILFMMLIFFSFRIELKEDSMSRFNAELADSLSSSPLMLHRSIFDPQKLTETENIDPKKIIELYAYNCDFGYNIEVESIGTTICSGGNECTGFCNSVCGLDGSNIDMSTVGTLNGNCGCNIEVFGDNFCQCKKPGGDWQNSYKWHYGYEPTSASNKQSRAEFPTAVGIDGTVIPATLTINSYDTVLTRLTCVTAKAYEIKSKQSVTLNTGGFASQIFERLDPQDTHVCLYDPTSNPMECRYFPGVTFEKLTLPETSKITVTAYPAKRVATCDEIKASPSIIAGVNDNVATVVLCST